LADGASHAYLPVAPNAQIFRSQNAVPVALRSDIRPQLATAQPLDGD
jgi:hypothetical protein